MKDYENRFKALSDYIIRKLKENQFKLHCSQKNEYKIIIDLLKELIKFVDLLNNKDTNELIQINDYKIRYKLLCNYINHERKLNNLELNFYGIKKNNWQSLKTKIFNNEDNCKIQNLYSNYILIDKIIEVITNIDIMNFNDLKNEENISLKNKK